MIELYETITDNDKCLIKDIYKGTHSKRLYEYLKQDTDEKIADDTFANGMRGICMFADPNSQEKVIVLCIGKVQSGKTGFFITSTAIAFDSGYKIAYIIGGTKNKLKKQNKNRITANFSYDDDIVVLDVNEATKEDIEKYLLEDKRVVLVVLKNNSLNKNLGKAIEIASIFKTIPSIVVDDEGDEASPGAPKKSKEAATHKNIAEILDTIDTNTYISVTATPQANILLSTEDRLSPDFVVLVKPGDDYTGGNSFHDTLSNPHVIKIEDFHDFDSKVPESFLDCFYFYVFACCLKNDGKPYSMLVHPSHLKSVHNNVAKKIKTYIEGFRESLNPDDIGYEKAIEKVKESGESYDGEYDFNEIEKRIPEVLNEMEVEIFNTSSLGVDEENVSNKKYKIYVGGEMLGRGLTIERLIVTYIYRDSKETNIDTLYQRARWFGYKKNYFDVCKVYMPGLLAQKFKATVDCENDMWNSINEFLKTNINFKKFKRIFSLNTQIENSKLNLTRKTVSNTVVLERINPGYTYNKGVFFNDDGRQEDRELFEEFLKKHKDEGKEYIADNSGYQKHLYWDMKYKDLYNEFICKYKFASPGTEFGPLTFRRLLDDEPDANIRVVVMRYEIKEYRSLDNSGVAIKELPQSYNNNTNYEGDKRIFENEFNIQIHLVYQDDINDYLPMLALNNPLTLRKISLVTGDNNYEN